LKVMVVGGGGDARKRFSLQKFLHRKGLKRLQRARKNILKVDRKKLGWCELGTGKISGAGHTCVLGKLAGKKSEKERKERVRDFTHKGIEGGGGNCLKG